MVIYYLINMMNIEHKYPKIEVTSSFHSRVSRIVIVGIKSKLFQKIWGLKQTFLKSLETKIEQHTKFRDQSII